MLSKHRGPSHGQVHSTPSGPLLSACLIVRDEAEMLPDCLASLRGIADEIVVVDTGSTDDTPEIARRAGAEVSHFEWCDDFAAARNAALAQAHGRWVLQIDADERLMAPGGRPPEGAALHRWLTDPPPEIMSVDAVLLPLRSVANGVEEVLPVLRLFQRRADRRYVRRIHETPFPPDTPGRFARFEGIEFLHLGYAPDIQIARGKNERNLRLCELAVVERPDDPEMHYYYGFELNRAGRKGEALSQFAVAWNRMPAWAVGSGTWWLTAVALGEAFNENGNAELVLGWAETLLQRFPNVAHLHFLRGDALRLLGRYDEAIVCLRTALALPPAGVAWEPWTTKPFSWNAIGAIAEQVGGLGEAREAYRWSLAIGPTTFAQERLAALATPGPLDDTGATVATVAMG